MYYQLLNQKDIFTLKFIVALFTIDKIRKQPKCPLIDKWKKEHVLYIYLMELPSHKKKDEILPFVTMWMDLESVMLSVRLEKDKYPMILLTCGILKKNE